MVTPVRPVADPRQFSPRQEQMANASMQAAILGRPQPHFPPYHLQPEVFMSGARSPYNLFRDVLVFFRARARACAFVRVVVFSNTFVRGFDSARCICNYSGQGREQYRFVL